MRIKILSSCLKQGHISGITIYSVPKDDPLHTSGTDKALYAAIKKKVSPCSVVLILAGIYSSHSKWIDKEIQIAQTEFLTTKPILAIEPWGSQRTSVKVKNAADEIVWLGIQKVLFQRFGG